MSSDIKEANLQITGMTCAACATRIEKGLNKMDGVEQATVNLALEKSSIKYDSKKLTEEDFEKKIEALGYGVVKQKTELDITGMTCAACATRIEKGLNKLSGISSANVNLALEKAVIEFNPSEVSMADIIAKVEKLAMVLIKRQMSRKQWITVKKPLNSNNGNLFFGYSFFTIALDDGRPFFLYVIFIYARIPYESMGPNAIGYSCAIYYW